MASTDRPTDLTAIAPQDIVLLVESILPEFIASRQARIESLNAQIGSLPSRVWEDDGEGAGHLEFDLQEAGDEHFTAGCIFRILTGRKPCS